MNQPTALIVEDNPEIVQLVRYALRREGYSSTAASSSDEGLAIAERSLPDLVILDVSLSGGSGLDMLGQMKANRRTRHVPVFMLTAHTMIGEMEVAFEMGADEYILKPITLERLCAVVDRALRRLRAADEF